MSTSMSYIEDLNAFKMEIERLLLQTDELEHRDARTARARELLDRARAVKLSLVELSMLLKAGLYAFIHEVALRESNAHTS
jgi:hypothetical protein